MVSRHLNKPEAQPCGGDEAFGGVDRDRHRQRDLFDPVPDLEFERYRSTRSRRAETDHAVPRQPVEPLGPAVAGDIVG
ncbi:hypothetical protein D3C72_2471470 [compost metagenome]